MINVTKLTDEQLALYLAVKTDDASITRTIGLANKYFEWLKSKKEKK